MSVLSERALNRATLARQLLLERSSMDVFDTVVHLVGLQAQVPNNPYLALWSRLEGFRPEELSQLLVERRVVRIVVMRGTLHLVTADDALVLRALAQPVLDKEMARHAEFAASLRGRDLAPAMAFARELLAEGPRTGAELRAAMAERFPDEDAAAFAFACRNLLGLVQVPPRGLWRQGGIVRSTTVDAWLGRPFAAAPRDIDDVVLRYFAAFGPATVADVATWSRLTALREVVERLRPRLRVFRDERGRELFDVPDGPLPDPDTPAPVRFLPEYDNVLLSHSDRSRFAADGEQTRLIGDRTVRGVVLHDGRGAATWRMDGTTLVVDPLVRLAKDAAEEIEAEGLRAIAFLEPERAPVVRIAGP